MYSAEQQQDVVCAHVCRKQIWVIKASIDFQYEHVQLYHINLCFIVFAEL